MLDRPSYTLEQLANVIGASIVGDKSKTITMLASLHSATQQQLTFYTDKRFKSQLAATNAGCVLLKPDDQSLFPGNKLVSVNPYRDYAKLTQLFASPTVPDGIHPTATIHQTVTLAEKVSIGPKVVIEEGAVVGTGVTLYPGCYIGADCIIGDNTTVYANVTLYCGTTIGQNCIVHSGAVLGADGFGFAPSETGWQKIHQLGKVVIGDHVEIGANTTIDRGALDDTIIGDGVIIDNQVQIAHNVVIGEQTAIAGAAAIAGSTVIGKRCTIAGAVGIVGHLTLADDVHITAMTLVTKSIAEPGSYSSGVPLNDTRLWRKNAARFNQLDMMARQLKLMKK